MFSQSEENYLKAIYQLSSITKDGVSTNDIAKKLETKASSVSDMIKRLSEKKLIEYKKYYGVRLTKEGEHIACSVVRKHRLWEVFLVDKLNFSWDEVHDVAEQLEHIKSPKLIEELDAFLGFPKKDPHGDPIPDKHGNYHVVEKTLLSNLHPGEKGICIGVKDSSSDFLKYLDRQAVKLGDEIAVMAKEDYDDSIHIKIDKRELNISKKIASNLYIQTP
ncbi:MAG: iron-dependent repressor [Flavobacteriaceae bacterium]|nr:iron-dependent repressor [Flavobacteriaceae bacterium]|tara:strand:- start:138672 stop:139328 length:657 start_codon:yes stop_codon:yes gene_type:complete